MSVTIARMQTQHNKLSIRSLTLISFRDCVVLKTKLAGEFKAVVCAENTRIDFVPAAIQRYEDRLPPQIQQMLLVLQSIHRTPPDDKFFILQDIVGQVVDNYLPMVTRARSFKTTKSSPHIREGTWKDPLDIWFSSKHTNSKSSMCFILKVL